MEEQILIGLTSIGALGVLAQWIAWRFGLPSIVMLLLVGLLAGPFTGFIDPDGLLGEMLPTLVSLAVAIILFEGGLTLRIDELREKNGKVVRNLVSVGVLVTWGISALAAYLILGLDPALALLLGAILSVTGPTVILPLLRQIRGIGKVGSILRWEGILIDPVGATLAVLVFEAIMAGESQPATTAAALYGFARTVIVGGLTGLGGAVLLYVALRRYWVPDLLVNAVTLMLVITSFTIADLLQPESGLLSVTVMGIVLANQRSVPVTEITKFKENLQVLLLAGLFVLLAARLEWEEITALELRHLLFLLVLILLARPLGVLLSTIRAGLSWREKLFLCWMAPRGIVAAAVSSIFALALVEAGHEGAEQLVPLTFLVIIGTVTLYGLTAVPLARWLGLIQANQNGFLIVGAHPWARELARTLQEAGYQVRLVDSNRANVTQSRLEGLTANCKNILAEEELNEIELDGLGRMLALTSNDEVNSLAALRFAEIFGRAEVYQIATQGAKAVEEESVARPLRGRILFAPQVTYSYLADQIARGAIFKRTSLTKEFDYEAYRALYGEASLPLFLITASGSMVVLTKEERYSPKPGDTLIALIDPRAQEKKSSREGEPLPA